MIRFSQAVEYGFLGLIELAKAKKPLALGELAKRANVPDNFLAKIFQRLQRAGIVVSKRGKTGGFVFPENNSSLSLWKVLSAIEGSNTLQKCVGEKGRYCECDRNKKCLLQKVWSDAQKSLEDTMEKWTIADLLK